MLARAVEMIRRKVARSISFMLGFTKEFFARFSLNLVRTIFQIVWKEFNSYV